MGKNTIKISASINSWESVRREPVGNRNTPTGKKLVFQPFTDKHSQTDS